MIAPLVGRPWEVMNPKQVYDRCAAAVMAEATPFLGLFSPRRGHLASGLVTRGQICLGEVEVTLRLSNSGWYLKGIHVPLVVAHDIPR